MATVGGAGGAERGSRQRIVSKIAIPTIYPGGHWRHSCIRAELSQSVDDQTGRPCAVKRNATGRAGVQSSSVTPLAKPVCVQA